MTQSHCPRCGADLVIEYQRQARFVGGSSHQRPYARCRVCKRRSQVRNTAEQQQQRQDILNGLDDWTTSQQLRLMKLATEDSGAPLPTRPVHHRTDMGLFKLYEGKLGDVDFGDGSWQQNYEYENRR